VQESFCCKTGIAERSSPCKCIVYVGAWLESILYRLSESKLLDRHRHRNGQRMCDVPFLGLREEPCLPDKHNSPAAPQPLPHANASCTKVAGSPAKQNAVIPRQERTLDDDIASTSVSWRLYTNVSWRTLSRGIDYGHIVSRNKWHLQYFSEHLNKRLAVLRTY